MPHTQLTAEKIQEMQDAIEHYSKIIDSDNEPNFIRAWACSKRSTFHMALGHTNQSIEDNLLQKEFEILDDPDLLINPDLTHIVLSNEPSQSPTPSITSDLEKSYDSVTTHESATTKESDSEKDELEDSVPEPSKNKKKKAKKSKKKTAKSSEDAAKELEKREEKLKDDQAKYSALMELGHQKISLLGAFNGCTEKKGEDFYNSAMKDFIDATKIDSQKPDAYVGLGELYQIRINEYSNAMEEVYQTALKNDRENKFFKEINSGLAELAIHRDQYTVALDYFKKIIQNSQFGSLKNALKMRSYLQAGQMLEKLGNAPGAKHYFQSASEQNSLTDPVPEGHIQSVKMAVKKLDAFEEAEKSRRAKGYFEAIKFYKQSIVCNDLAFKALKITPTFYDKAHEKLTVTYIAQQDYKKAMEVIALEKSVSPISMLHVRMLLREGAPSQDNLEKALSILQDAHERLPKNAEICFELAIMSDFLRVNIPDASVALHITPKKIKDLYDIAANNIKYASFSRGNLVRNQGNYEQVVQHYSKGIADPALDFHVTFDALFKARAYCQLGYAHYKLGNRTAAIEAFKNAIELNPTCLHGTVEFQEISQDPNQDLIAAIMPAKVQVAKVRSNLSAALDNTCEKNNTAPKHGNHPNGLFNEMNANTAVKTERMKEVVGALTECNSGL